MEIKVHNASYGTEIIVTADNVIIEERISEGVYATDSEGKKDFKRRIGEDIITAELETLCNLLDDVIYYRKADFDSSDLICRLFEKLPQQKAEELAAKLFEDYQESDNS